MTSYSYSALLETDYGQNQTIIKPNAINIIFLNVLIKSSLFFFLNHANIWYVIDFDCVYLHSFIFKEVIDVIKLYLKQNKNASKKFVSSNFLYVIIHGFCTKYDWKTKPNKETKHYNKNKFNNTHKNRFELDFFPLWLIFLINLFIFYQYVY